MNAGAVVAAPLAGLSGGLILWLAGAAPSPAFWAGTLPVLALLLLDTARSLRRGEFGLDLIAALAMGFGLALGEALAANVVALMFAGGRFLEDYASRRARAEMTALLARQPRTALRHGPHGIEEVALSALRAGDLLAIPRGAVLPVDGVVEAGTAILDTAPLTGEPMPVRRDAGEEALSGCTNAGDAFALRATSDAAASTFAAILRLVQAAQDSRAPMARLADRWALGFLALTLLLAGGAWTLTGEAQRGLAVLVVATPCPLILAVPVALVAGLSRTARMGVLVKSGAALEALARIRAVLLDKTGTLTEGSPRVTTIATAPGVTEAEALRLAASLDQLSHHPVAQAIVAETRRRGLSLETPSAAREEPGEGMAGQVGGRSVQVGGLAWLGRDGMPDPPRAPGAMRCGLRVDGAPAATFLLEDPPRPEAASAVAALRGLGVARIVLVSGDADGPVRAVAAQVGADAALARQSPADKVAAIAAERAHGPVLMLGDGINDAPALAAADLGVAMGARGAAAAAEAAEAVLLSGGLERLGEAMAAAQRARRIALQSVAAGLGLSVIGMVAAALGHLTPVEGALLQEGIDVAVILNALRALR
ncbi:MAG: cadmium-translocating P-type ATPase [Acetobacteraceae bacterium]|nr:cadmium-translocating P-type ATPase [Acetobacteraceae bacterium]